MLRAALLIGAIRAAQERSVTVCWKSASFLKAVDLILGQGRSRQQPIAQKQTVRRSRLLGFGEQAEVREDNN
jgi:hypothetical protein